MISFEPLFKTLEEKGLKPVVLRKAGLVDGKQLRRMQEGGASFSTDTIEKICKYLDVPIEKVVEIKK